jgi:hypothetical protein
MNLLWAIVAQTAVILGGCLVIILYNNARFDAIDRRFDDRFDAIDQRFEDLLRYIDQRFKNLEDRLGRLDERVSRIEDRLEHPVLPGR